MLYQAQKQDQIFEVAWKLESIFVSSQLNGCISDLSHRLTLGFLVSSQPCFLPPAVTLLSLKLKDPNFAQGSSVFNQSIHCSNNDVIMTSFLKCPFRSANFYFSRLVKLKIGTWGNHSVLISNFRSKCDKGRFRS